MKPGQIRPLAIGVFSWNGSILVSEGYDTSKQQFFFRPIGGGINFGEYSQAALVREVREEFGAEIEGLRYLGTLENVFIHNNQAGHEIVQIYDAAFVDRSLYEQESLVGQEDSGLTFTAYWKLLTELKNDPRPLYPTGLLELLQQHGLT